MRFQLINSIYDIKTLLNLLDFLSLTLFLKKEKVIKKNGKFPQYDKRFESRSGYKYYLTLVLKKYLFWLTNLTFVKERGADRYKTVVKSYVYDPQYKIRNHIYVLIILWRIHHSPYQSYDIRSIGESEIRAQYNNILFINKGNILTYFENVIEQNPVTEETFNETFLFLLKEISENLEKTEFKIIRNTVSENSNDEVITLDSTNLVEALEEISTNLREQNSTETEEDVAEIDILEREDFIDTVRIMRESGFTDDIIREYLLTNFVN